MNIKEKILSHTQYQFFSNLILMLLGIMSSVFFARMLGASDFGRMQFIFWILTIAGLFATCGFNGVLSRYLALYQGKNDSSNVGKIISLVLVTELSLSVIVVSLIFVFRGQIWNFFDEPLLESCFWILFISIIPGCVADVARFSLTGLQKIKELAWFSVIAQSISFAGNVLIILLGYGLKGIIVFNLLIIILKSLYLWSKVSRCVQVAWFKFPEKKISHEIFKYNSHLTVIVLTDQVIWQRSEIFFLQKFSTSEEIAFYSLAFGWGARLIGFLPGVLGGFLIPVMAELQGADKHESIKRSFFQISKYSSFVLIPMTFCILAVSNNFIHTLYGADYHAVPVLMVPIFLSKCFVSLFAGASAVIFATGRQTFIMRWGLVLAGLNIMLDFYLIRGYGAIGAAWATSIVHFLAGLITLLYICRWLKYKVPFAFQIKLFVICLILYFPIRLLSASIPGIAGLLISISINILFFLIAVKITKVFSREDHDILIFLSKRLPKRLTPLFNNYFSINNVEK